MSPFDFAQFWNSKMRGPICFSPPAMLADTHAEVTNSVKQELGITRTIRYEVVDTAGKLCLQNRLQWRSGETRNCV